MARQKTLAWYSSSRLEGLRILQRLFGGTYLLLAASAVVVYLYIACARLTYPFALEWIEPNSYAHVARVLQGLPLYGPPSYDFIPMLYTPLYFYVAAAVAWGTNDITLAMRLVSLSASLVTFGLLYGIARLRGLAPVVAVLAVGLFAVTYGISSYWFDISRVDMLFVALLLLAYLLALTDSRPAWRAGVLSGVVLCLAFMTKQQGAVAFPFLGGYLLLRRDWSRALAFGGSFLASVGLYLLVATLHSGGWFWFYVFTVPGAAPIQPQLQHDFWAIQVLPHFYPALISIGLSLLVLALRREWAALHRQLAFIGALGVPLLAMSYLSMTKQWGFVNGLMPLAAALALLTAEAAQVTVNAASHWPTRGRPAEWVVLMGSWLAAVLIALQFLVLRYDIAPAIPSAADRIAGEQLVQLLHQVSGPTFASTATNLLTMAGQPGHFHPSSLGDLSLAAQTSPAAKAVLDQYGAAIDAPFHDGTIRTALLPNVHWYDQVFSEQNGYHCMLLPASQRLTTVSGARSTLETLCRKP